MIRRLTCAALLLTGNPAAYAGDSEPPTEPTHILQGEAGPEIFAPAVAAASPDGQRALLGALSFTLDTAYLYNAETGEHIRTFHPTGKDESQPRPAYFGSTVSISNSRALVLAPQANDDNGAAYLYDSDNGDFIARLVTPSPIELGFSVRHDLNEDYVITATDGNQVAVFSAEDGQFIKTVSTPPRPGFRYYRPPAVSLFGDTLLTYQELFPDPSGQRFGELYLFDIPSGDLIRTFTIEDLPTLSVARPFIELTDAYIVLRLHIQLPNDPELLVLFQVIDKDTGEVITNIEQPADATDSIRDFGYASAVLGNRILISAPDRWDPPQNSNRSTGQAYLYDLTTGELLQRFAETGFSPERVANHFGETVALSESSCFIGSEELVPSLSVGLTYQFSTKLGELTRYYHGNFYPENDRAGSSIHSTGDEVFIGIPGRGAEPSTGEIYVFNQADLQRDRTIQPSVPLISDYYATNLAVADGRLLSASPQPENNFPNAGYFEIVTLDGSAPTRRQTAPTTTIIEGFGDRAALASDIAVIAAPFDLVDGVVQGSAWLYDTNAQLIAQIIPDDIAPQDGFGYSIALDDNHLFISAPNLSAFGSRSGKVYKVDRATGEIIAQAITTDSAQGDNFGYSMCVAGGYLIVGAPGDGQNGRRAGAVYLFDPVTLEQRAKIVPVGSTMRNEFGRVLDAHGDLLAVTSRGNDESGTGTGIISLVDLRTLEIVEVISPAQSITNTQLTLEIDNDWLYLGLPEFDEPRLNAGLVLVYPLPDRTCPGDTNNDNTVDLADLNAVLALFGQPTTSGADLDNSGAVDLADLNIVLSAFGTACD